MFKSETKSNKWRKEQSSLVKQSKNAMMSSISPREEQTSSKARKSWKSLYDERMVSSFFRHLQSELRVLIWVFLCKGRSINNN